MLIVIKNGIIVIVDLIYEVDVFIENGVIMEIGKGLFGNEELDVIGCYVMFGGIDLYVYLEMLFMGIYFSDDFEFGICVGLVGGIMMVVDFCLFN